MNTNFRHIGRGCEIDRIESTEIGEKVILGDNVKLIISGMAKCFIGNNVGVADGTYIRSANHKFSDLNTNILDQGHNWNKVQFNNKEYGIVIEDNVWIGARAIILSGAHIGAGSVVSAGCVISNKIPENSIVVGNPGRVIGNREKKANEKI
jgi:acetyltransferase-like isoleucine patch superfamily enzyme